MFGDYKSYKKFAPQYTEWKSKRDFQEAKCIKYLQENPNAVKQADIQKSKAILRAIDVMDEYSQRKAENAEVATESIVSTGLELAMMAGMGLAFLAIQLKPLQNLLKKYSKNDKKLAFMYTMASTVAGGMLGTVAAFPLYAWAAKAEVKASRRGRFEAMKKELSDPKTFAVLNEEQEKQLAQNLKTLETQKEKKEIFKGFKESWEAVKGLAVDSKSYLKQRLEFETDLAKDKKHFDKELTPKEIEDAKKDQQLLTKLVEKIDIASQDYAENAELATSAVMTTVYSLGALFTLCYEKIAKSLKLKTTAVPAYLSMGAMLFSSIFAAQIQKQASRVGRFKVKQELLKNPEQLVYVADEKTGEIKDVQINSQKKTGMFKFLKEAWKNNKEFENWKKTQGAEEKKLSKAMENIELSDEQLKDAKRLQHNTFKTFNKIDENSQKYAESIEALGQAIQYPLGLILGGIGVALGMKHLTKIKNPKNTAEMTMPLIKYVSTVFLATLPSIGINAYITKEQKKASRVANMLAINEMQDYRNFADYSRFR